MHKHWKAPGREGVIANVITLGMVINDLIGKSVRPLILALGKQGQVDLCEVKINLV